MIIRKRHFGRQILRVGILHIIKEKEKKKQLYYYDIILMEEQRNTMFLAGCVIGAFAGFAVGVILAALLYIDKDK